MTKENAMGKKNSLKTRRAEVVLKELRLHDDIAGFIQESLQRVSTGVHAEMVNLYWRIGKRIRDDILESKRAEYSKQIIENLAGKLSVEYGRGYTRTNLFNMVRFAEFFLTSEVLSTVDKVLTWSHFRILIYIDDELKRDFYTQMCRIEKWSVRILQQKIDGMLFERTAISQKPRELIRRELAELREKESLPRDFVFQDPYLLDFLGLHGSYSEKDLENAILHKLERFLLELGSDFAFIGRQKRITIDNDDYYIDLLFYHRGLFSLVVVELKLGKFKASYKGQMELYLRYLEKYEKKANENLPVGLILCAEKSEEVIELMHLAEDRIRVAEYWTHLPPKKLLQEKLHNAMGEAQQEIDQRGGEPAEVGDDENVRKLSAIERDILGACKDEWQSSRQIAEKIGYKRDRVSKQIKTLVGKGLLEMRYPKNPRHPRQEYLALGFL